MSPLLRVESTGKVRANVNIQGEPVLVHQCAQLDLSALDQIRSMGAQTSV